MRQEEEKPWTLEGVGGPPFHLPTLSSHSGSGNIEEVSLLWYTPRTLEADER